MKYNWKARKVALLLICTFIGGTFVGCGDKVENGNSVVDRESSNLAYDGTVALGNKAEFEISKVTLPEEVETKKVTKIDGNSWYYDLDSEGNAINVHVYGNYSGDVTLPSTLDGHKVISIGRGYASSGNELFFWSMNQERYLDNITSITVPDGVKYINSQALAYCDNLQKVILPDSVIYIGNDVFDGDDNLAYINSDVEGKVVMPENLQYYGESLFTHTKKINSFEFPKQIDYIQNWTFYQTKGFDELTIPGQFKYIGHSAFCDSTITKVTIEDGVEMIDGSAFAMNDRLKKVNIADSVVSIGGGAFQLCKVLERFNYTGKLNYIGADVFKYNTKKDFIKYEQLPN